MNAAHVADRAPDTIDDIADWLTIAYLRLHRAAAVAQYLAVIDPTYRHRPGCDLALAIHETISAIDHSVHVRELAVSNGFWVEPLGPAAVAAANAHATLPSSAADAADRLLDHLGAAFGALLNAADHASDTDTDIDDALHAVCNALRTATTHPEAGLDTAWDIAI